MAGRSRPAWRREAVGLSEAGDAGDGERVVAVVQHDLDGVADDDPAPAAERASRVTSPGPLGRGRPVSELTGERGVATHGLGEGRCAAGLDRRADLVEDHAKPVTEPGDLHAGDAGDGGDEVLGQRTRLGLDAVVVKAACERTTTSCHPTGRCRARRRPCSCVGEHEGAGDDATPMVTAAIVRAVGGCASAGCEGRRGAWSTPQPRHRLEHGVGGRPSILDDRAVDEEDHPVAYAAAIGSWSP